MAARQDIYSRWSNWIGRSILLLVTVLLLAACSTSGHGHSRAEPSVVNEHPSGTPEAPEPELESEDVLWLARGGVAALFEDSVRQNEVGLNEGDRERILSSGLSESDFSSEFVEDDLLNQAVVGNFVLVDADDPAFGRLIVRVVGADVTPFLPWKPEVWNQLLEQSPFDSMWLRDRDRTARSIALSRASLLVLTMAGDVSRGVESKRSEIQDLGNGRLLATGVVSYNFGMRGSAFVAKVTFQGDRIVDVSCFVMNS